MSLSKAVSITLSLPCIKDYKTPVRIKFHLPISSGSSAASIRPSIKDKVRKATIILLYILEEYLRKRTLIFVIHRSRS